MSDKREVLAQRVSAMLARLSGPLDVADVDGGWCDQNRLAMVAFFERLLRDIQAGSAVEDAVHYQTICRGMDYWGIVEGPLLQEAAEISSLVRALK